MPASIKAVAKGSGKFVPVSIDDDDDDDYDAPKPPPPGAPAWLATFADIATNLMAFFVLILGFAKFDEPSFKKMAGSMRETFGTEVVSPVLEYMDGGTVLELDFRPQGMPADPVQGEEPPRGDEGQWQDRGGADEGRAPSDGAGLGSGAASDESASAAAQEAAKAAAQALMEALANGEVRVEQGQKQVTVRLPEDASGPSAERVAEALASLAGTEPEIVEEPGDQSAPPDEPAEEGTGEAAPGDGGEGGTAAGRATSPGFAKAKLSVALRDQSAQGLVEVERRDGSVFVTVGAGGAFASGSAELTPEAEAIMDAISQNALGPNATITVTGHTDNVPLGDSPFVDNFGLGAARASAVVRALVDRGTVAPTQVTAVSKGETMPVADNSTDEGREKNRRVEIQIDYDDVPGAD